MRGGRKQAGRVLACSSTGSSGSAGFAAACAAATAAGRATAGAAGAGRALGTPGPCTGAAACMIGGLLYSWRDPCSGVGGVGGRAGRPRPKRGADGARIRQRARSMCRCQPCSPASTVRCTWPALHSLRHSLVCKLHFNSSLRLGTRPMDMAAVHDRAHLRPPCRCASVTVKQCVTSGKRQQKGMAEMY